MKKLILLVAIAGLLVACAAPPATQPAGTPAVQQSLPDVTVFRSPT